MHPATPTARKPAKAVEALDNQPLGYRVDILSRRPAFFTSVLIPVIIRIGGRARIALAGSVVGRRRNGVKQIRGLARVEDVRQIVKSVRVRIA
jgi:hypothetical protein